MEETAPFCFLAHGPLVEAPGHVRPKSPTSQVSDLSSIYAKFWDGFT